jgi:hypothetical protein
MYYLTGLPFIIADAPFIIFRPELVLVLGFVPDNLPDAIPIFKMFII